MYMHGAEVGRRHDMNLYQESKVDAVLHKVIVIKGTQYFFSGDEEYMMRT